MVCFFISKFGGIEMSEINNNKFDFYYGKEAEQFNFYRIPKLLFTDSRFSKVSIEAKVLYGLMLCCRERKQTRPCILYVLCHTQNLRAYGA